MMDESQDRALRLNTSMSRDWAYITQQDHRMHHVCSTLEALGYTERLYNVGERKGESAWRLSVCGIDLYSELAAQHRARGELA
jgi:hypothetical protein